MARISLLVAISQIYAESKTVINCVPCPVMPTMRLECSVIGWPRSKKGNGTEYVRNVVLLVRSYKNAPLIPQPIIPDPSEVKQAEFAVSGRGVIFEPLTFQHSNVLAEK